MQEVRHSNNGFGAIELLLILVVVAVLAGAGVYVYHREHKTKTTGSTSQNSTVTTTKPDPYAGWKTNCDSAIKACYRYPSDWVASQFGGYQNSTNTAYFRYQEPDTKDQSAADAYIARIADVSVQTQGLKVVGYIVNNVPTYVVYDASAVSNLVAGQTAKIVTGNPSFTTKQAGADVTFVATPGASGIAAITSMDQAKAWFNTPEASTCLKVLQSFYYQQ